MEDAVAGSTGVESTTTCSMDGQRETPDTGRKEETNLQSDTGKQRGKNCLWKRMCPPEGLSYLWGGL